MSPPYGASACVNAADQVGQHVNLSARPVEAPTFCHQQTALRWNLAQKAPPVEFYVSTHVLRTP
jgi:hypothetical protein